ncbi:MAG TPA: hypothetical protein VK470_07280, partial [Bacteroidota bacterium]|nr:hypothetical protein [Bacteroidota bacterium]
MKRLASIFFVLAMLPAFLCAGNLSVQISPLSAIFGAAPGDTVVYFVSYTHQGTDAATNISVKVSLPKALKFLSSYPLATSNVDSSYTYTIGTLSGIKTGMIMVSTLIPKTTPLGSKLHASAVISGTAANDQPEDNTGVSDLELSTPGPDLWVFNWGLLEEMEAGNFLMAEQNVECQFEFTYFNFSKYQAQNAKLIDTLAPGLQFVSSNPAPSSTANNIIVWNLGTLDGFADGKISVVLKPTKTGNIVNAAVMTTTSGDQNPKNDRSTFTFEVKPLLQPRLLKPHAVFGSDDLLLLGKNPAFSGLAKAGATVALYEGDSLGTFGDFSNLHPKLLGSAVAGPDRKWQIKPTGMTESKTYFLYVRAELNGQASAPFFDFWQPIKIRIEPMIDLSGFDMDQFSVQTGDNVVKPGALGTTSGSLPEADLIITKRLNAPFNIMQDTTLWANHKMKLHIKEGDTEWDEEWPPTKVDRPGPPSGNPLDPFDFTYKHKGFRAGAKVEVWCLPEYYDEKGQLVLSGLVWVKCHEVLIDPAGYVYDKDIAGTTVEWPEVPPAKSLIKNATVTCLVRTGDNSFVKWDAASYNQVNPQVTDSLTNDKVLTNGYFAFFVPSGQYQINATAPDYMEYVSPVLTVVDEPVYHNVGMTHLQAKEATAVRWP